MVLNGTVELWQLLMLVGTGLLIGAGFHWKNVALTDDLNQLKENSAAAEARLATELAKVKQDLQDHRLHQGQFELGVTDRLARIETTLGQGLARVESAIREALKP
jgi:hypothetical protein